MGGDPTRVLITGGAGLVAAHLLRTRPPGVEVSLTWRTRRPHQGTPAHRVELTDPAAVEDLFERVAPDLVIHTAYRKDSWADVVDASGQVALACARRGVDLVHLSSDLVFDGTSAPYVEGDPVRPVDAYGRAKAVAEQRVLELVPDATVTRTSLVVSADPLDPVSAALVAAVRSPQPPTLFVDEVRTPIRAEDLARVLWRLTSLERRRRAGVWHLPGPEALSRLELARRVLRREGLGGVVLREGSVHDHPVPRAADVRLASRRPPLGVPLRPVA